MINKSKIKGLKNIIFSLIERIIFRTLFVLLFISITLYSCNEKNKEPKKLKVQENYELQPDQIGWNVEVNFNDSNFTKAILKAKRTRIYQKNAETLLDSGLKVEFFSRQSGKRVSILTAEEAKIDDNTKNMIAKGNVVVIGDSNNSKLETSILHWNNQTQKLYSTEFVKITTQNEILQGYGFESDQNLNNYRIFKVSGVRNK